MDYILSITSGHADAEVLTKMSSSDPESLVARAVRLSMGHVTDEMCNALETRLVFPVPLVWSIKNETYIDPAATIPYYCIVQ